MKLLKEKESQWISQTFPVKKKKKISTRCGSKHNLLHLWLTLQPSPSELLWVWDSHHIKAAECSAAQMAHYASAALKIKAAVV